MLISIRGFSSAIILQTAVVSAQSFFLFYKNKQNPFIKFCFVFLNSKNSDAIRSLSFSKLEPRFFVFICLFEFLPFRIFARDVKKQSGVSFTSSYHLITTSNEYDQINLYPGNALSLLSPLFSLSIAFFVS